MREDHIVESTEDRFEAILRSLEKIGADHDEALDSKISVEIKDDGMEAYLVITPPKIGGRIPLLRDILNKIKEMGIQRFDESSILNALEKRLFKRPILIAKGRPPTKGDDAKLEVKVKGGKVNRGEVIAIKKPKGVGESGVDVFGREIPPLVGKEIEIIPGNGVNVDGPMIYASRDGEVRWSGNRVEIIEHTLLEEEIGEVSIEELERKFELLGRSLEEMVGRRSNIDGRVEIMVNQDKTQAHIRLIPPKIGGAKIELDAIFKALRQRGIIEFDTNRIKEAFLKKEFNKDILVAKGVPPTKGDDGYIVYRFGVTEDGENLYKEVFPGQLLALKVNPTYGRPGKAVTGEEIQGELGNDVVITLGRGVVMDQDGERVYAARSGRAIWEGNRIQVEEIKEIYGDITPELGDIDFSGRVLIHGSVRDGVMIKSGSDIIIEGGVGDATLISGGSISVGGAIFGKGNGKITSKGDLKATSCEGMMIDTEGNVIIDEFIKRSTIRARKKVVCLGRKGQIEGGRIIFAEAIDAKILGSEAKTKTELNVVKGGRICCQNMIHPNVVVSIGGTSIQVKNPKRGIRFVLDGSKIKEEPYSKEEIKEAIIPIDEEVKIQDLIPFVVVYSSSKEKALEKGARLLGLSPWKVEVEKIQYDEDRGMSEFRVFPSGAKGGWMKRIEGMAIVDGGYRITNKEEGLFLTVFPPRGGRPVDPKDVLLEIREGNFVDIDEEAVRRCVEEASSIPVRIGPRQRNPDIDGTAVVEISDDGKRATLILTPPQPGGLEVTYEDVMKALRTKRVVAGIKEGEIRNALSNRRYLTPIVVAEEIPPTPGKLSEIRYHFDLHPSKRPIEDGEGRVDFKELNIIQNVRAGEVLATRIPSSLSGIPGRRITGEEIPPPRLEEERLPAGKNTEISQDGLELRATIDGHVTFVNEKINVEPVYEIKGNVDMSTGNIDFLGTVDISGDIQDGFKVRAEGDIQVRGGVGKAILSAGGNINIIQGIQSNHEGRIWAGKDIVCKFVENGELFARGNITIYEEVLHSEVDAGGSVNVIGKRGLIIGGRVRAKDEVTAKTIGCEMATSTVIEVGVPPKIREELSNLMNLFKEELMEFESVRSQIKGLRRQKEEGGFTQEKEERLSHLLNMQNLLARRLQGLSERKEMLEKALLGCKGGIVNIIGTVYPGVKIIIRDAEFEVMEPIHSVTFFYEGGKVRHRPYMALQEPPKSL